MKQHDSKDPLIDEGEDNFKEGDDLVLKTALRHSFWVIAGLVLLGFGLWLGSRRVKEVEVQVKRENVAAPAKLAQVEFGMPAVVFRELEPGLVFVSENGARGKKYLPESMGTGVAVFDADGDGLLDLFFNNAQAWPEDGKNGRATTKLFHNAGAGKFVDVSDSAGLAVSLYGTGVAVGDVDQDGDPDLYLTALGRNRLFLNTGGRFEEAQNAWGAAGSETAWSTSAGFFDYDRDGDLDLFVANYVQWQAELDLKLNFSLDGRNRAYGPPLLYEGSHSSLFRNDGGRFTDVSAAAGIEVVNPATGKPMGKALAVTFVDVDEDGWLDILVANDTVANFAFHNLGGTHFEELGATSGLAFDGMGSATGSMGMDTTYLNGHSQLSVAISNFALESSAFYVQQPENPWTFADMANSLGVGSPSRLKLSFGLFFFDYDLDGRQDLLQVNGHLETEINTFQSSQTYRQEPQLFWHGRGQGPAFSLVPAAQTGDLGKAIVGRASAYGDLDGDGDLDLVMTTVAGPATVLFNEQETGHHWLRLSLKGKTANREAIGALVEIEGPGFHQRQSVMPTRSYLAQVEPTLTFGLGQASQVDKITIVWPDGKHQELSGLAVDRQHLIEQLN